MLSTRLKRSVARRSKSRRWAHWPQKHPGQPGGKAEARVWCRQAEDDRAVEARSLALRVLRERNAPRLSVPGGGSPSRVSIRPLSSPTISTPSCTASRERDAVNEHVVLAVAVRRLTQDAESGIADEPDGLHRLPDQ